MPKITFVNWDATVEVKPGTTLLEAAELVENRGVKMGHACGGVCACSTCHVYVKQGLDSLSDQEENEEDILDKAFDVRPQSRLSCQSKISDEDLVIEISAESRRAWLDEHPEERAKRG